MGQSLYSEDLSQETKLVTDCDGGQEEDGTASHWMSSKILGQEIASLAAADLVYFPVVSPRHPDICPSPPSENDAF